MHTTVMNLMKAVERSPSFLFVPSIISLLLAKPNSTSLFIAIRQNTTCFLLAVRIMNSASYPGHGTPHQADD